MSSVGDLDYALARLKARRANATRAAGWAPLRIARSLAAALDALRGGLGPAWAEGLGTLSEAHAIESHLRGRFRAQVEEIAGWTNPAWQPPLLWCGWLPWLPLLRHGSVASLPEDWPAEELPPLAAGDPPRRGEAQWRSGLAQRMPAVSEDETLGFTRLEHLLLRHRERFAALPAGSGWLERERLEADLEVLRWREPLAPVLQGIAVAQLWLDHERVRGELLRLVLVPEAIPA
jgi:hypothetical protein